MKKAMPMKFSIRGVSHVVQLYFILNVMEAFGKGISKLPKHKKTNQSKIICMVHFA